MKYIFILVFHLLFSSAFSQNVDIDLLNEFNSINTSSLDPTFRFITNSVTPLSVAVPVAFVTYAFIKKDSISKDKAVVVCSSLLLTNIISTSLKYVVHRERPFDAYPFIEKKTSAHGYSFPSGHTASAFATATSISIAYPKWYVIVPSYLWASAVGYSRMELGVHYPTDVLAGAIVGAGSALLSYKLNQWIKYKCKSRHK